MTRRIGAAGRRAMDLAQDRVEVAHHGHTPAPALFPISEGQLPLLQRAALSSPAESSGSTTPTSTPAAPADAAVERETPAPSPAEVADRVYHLFCQDLRRGRERRWR